jgi:hypothetical protein
MGIRFHKSFKAGPVRVNLSESGVGASVGVKGARVGIDAKGNSTPQEGKAGFISGKIQEAKTEKTCK